ncbi:MAG: DUF1385 domain-containing protein [Thermoleophilia bacterium]|nr:DUF1385 domain-containing protein [Thermoleophilia bacterium]
MRQEKLRLGGMALTNGVLVHGPSAWAAAVRTPDGELKVAGAAKRFRAAELDRPLLRGPARLLEAVAVLPEMRRMLPQARLPFERPAVIAALLASAPALRVVRESKRLGPVSREILTSVLALTPAAVALRGSALAAYHGAEHVAIGSYEHGEKRSKEHERCGSHLLGPMLLTSAVARTVTARLAGPLAGVARAAAALAALAAATEMFGWMLRHPDDPLSKALARPGHELQHRLATAEPSEEQLEVAEAALAECLRLEQRDE